MMIALSVYDQVLPGIDLARGRTVAGTGSIDEQGRVGPIGGAGLKVIAAHRKGADVFLAPAANIDAARQALGEQPATGPTPRRAECPVGKNA